MAIELLQVNVERKKNWFKITKVLHPIMSVPTGVVAKAKHIKAPKREINKADIIRFGSLKGFFLVANIYIRYAVIDAKNSPIST